MSCLKFILTLLTVLVAGVSCFVQTNTGPVQGQMLASGKVEAYLGIPYAEAPIGHLRFAKPVPKKSWEGIYNATSLPPACIQVRFPNDSVANVNYMSEDCLYLNLWVPRCNCISGLKTIMLFIHGGTFLFGGSNLPIYDGGNLAEHGDVIIVTINYRLGGLGFLTDFTDDAPGNVGLYDQIMAIKWIKDNAEHFNGDPENIVLFGESAGAYAISLHQISPLSRNLFKRAILESGSALSPMFDDNNAELKNMNHVYANLVGCKYNETKLTNNPKDVIECLRKVPAEKFSEIDMEAFVKRSRGPIPRVGDDFLPETTIDAFRKGHFEDSEVLMGINRNEGPLFLVLRYPDVFGQFGEKIVTSMFNESMAYNIIKSMTPSYYPAEVDKIIRSYIDDVNLKRKYTYLNAASDAIGDFIINCGQIFQAEYQSFKSNAVFFYVFNHRPTSSPFAKWMGATHFDEMQFVFGNQVFQNFTKYEMNLSRDIMDMWTTFSKTGNPNIPGGARWPRYTYQHPSYLTIGKRNNVGLRPDHYRCERLRKIYRSV